jgi:hypothetical protein
VRVGDVVGLQAFLLHLVVIDHGAVAERDLSDRVREVRVFGTPRNRCAHPGACRDRQVTLDERRPAVLTGDDERARRDRQVPVRGLHKVQELDRTIHDDVVRHKDEGAVVQQGGVEGREHVGVGSGDAGELQRFLQLGGRQIADGDAGRQLAQRR